MSEQREAGKALDAEIAERVFGFTWEPVGADEAELLPPTCTHTLVGPWHGPDGGVQMRSRIAERYSDKPTAYFSQTPFSTDIAAALSVVDAMAGTHDFALIRNEFGWEAEFGGHRAVRAFADTAPLCICLAALDAIKAAELPASPDQEQRER